MCVGNSVREHNVPFTASKCVLENLTRAAPKRFSTQKIDFAPTLPFFLKEEEMEIRPKKFKNVLHNNRRMTGNGNVNTRNSKRQQQ